MAPSPPPANDGERNASEAPLNREKGPDREMGKYMGLGLQFAASVALLTFGGFWLDGKVGTLPLFTMLGALLGFAGATISLVHKVPPAGGKRRDDPPSSS